jgi:hypothetical protein
VQRTETVPVGEAVRVRVENQSRGIVDEQVVIDGEPACMLTLEAGAAEELQLAPGTIAWRWLDSAMAEKNLKFFTRGGESHAIVRN